jgi:V/A-type H+/Na+-transporting ATPase subunit K
LTQRKVLLFYYFNDSYLVIIKYGIYARTINMKRGAWGIILTLAVLITFISIHLITMGSAAYAQTPSSGSDTGASRLIGAGLAFGLAGAGAGIGLGFVGAAGLAAISDNPKMQSRVFIFVGMVESIAIYGIVMMFIILGQK